MPHIIQSAKSRRYYVQRTQTFSGTRQSATRFPSFDHAEEKLEDLGLLGNKTYQVITAPETQKQKAAAARKAARQKAAAEKAAKKALAAGKKGKKGRRTAKNPGIVQNADGSSYGPIYLRKNGQRVVSGRRFRTEAEARHHGQRFQKKRQLLVQFYAAGNPVNSWVNWNSGMTNPSLDKKQAAAPAVMAERADGDDEF